MLPVGGVLWGSLFTLDRAFEILFGVVAVEETIRIND